MSKAKARQLRRTVRLACSGCDYNGNGGSITAAALRKLKTQGWEGVSREQTWKQATDTGPVWMWWTHIGLCPSCAARGVHR